jgi:hypothetical protein
MVLGHHLHISPFSLAYKLWSRISMSQVPHTFIIDLISVEDLLYFPWNYGVAYGHILQALSCANEWKTNFGIIFRFDVDTTSSWWKPRTTKGARSSWSQSPLSLVLSHFFKLSHFGAFVANRPRFWWWTWNHLWRLLQDWQHFHLRMVFNS